MKVSIKKNKIIITLEYTQNAKTMIEDAALEAGISPALFILVGHRVFMDVLSGNPAQAKLFAQNIGDHARYLALSDIEKN